MKPIVRLLAAASLAIPAGVMAQETFRTPEGAQMNSASDLAYKTGELTAEQLAESTRATFRQDSMNVFRRFPREKTAEMIKFYTEALALRSLSPIQLTTTQQMILTGVGSGQIKLSAGQQGDRKYDMEGGYYGGTGIRFFILSYPDADVVKQRFATAGFDEPVGINVADLDKSRAFYRDFVGLDELEPVDAPVLGTTFYPYRHKETTLMLYKLGDNAHPDNGSAGIQYVVSDSPLADAKAKARGIAVETPLNKLAGFDLVTVWLNDPDGVTNYYAQVGPNSRTARGEN